MKRLVLMVVWTLLASAAESRAQIDSPTVGIEGRLEVLLPGPELKAKPADRAAPLNVRIAATRPHGTLMQYDLRYIGLVPGSHDLRQYLLRPDGSPATDLPPLTVQVTGLLPAQHQGELALHRGEGLAALGGYRWVLGGAAVLWAALAVPLYLTGRRRKAPAPAPAASRPPTLAERLRPLVELATTGKLSADQQAQLERLLLGHWRERLGLESCDASEAMSRLHAHPEAGALLRSLEDWLYRPPGTADVDLDAVLAPYGKLESSEAGSLTTSRPTP